MKVRDMVRRYKDSDFEQISEWLIERGQKVFHPNVLPQTGFIVDQVAAIFVYETDSDMCYLENLVANPFINQEAKDYAITELIEAAFAHASNNGFKFILAVTDHPKVIERALAVGAHIEMNKVLLTKQLK